MVTGQKLAAHSLRLAMISGRSPLNIIQFANIFRQNQFRRPPTIEVHTTEPSPIATPVVECRVRLSHPLNTHRMPAKEDVSLGE